MSKRDIQKNFSLSAQFNEYVVRHPEVAKPLVDNACVVFLPKDDPVLSEKNRKMASIIMEKNQRKCYGAVKAGRKWNLMELRKK
jgi:hypothetical protein